MANEFRRGYTPYEEPEDEDGLFAQIGRKLKKAFVRDESRLPTTGRSVDFSGMPSRGPMKAMAQKAARKPRENPVMTSNKNVNEGLGRGTVPLPELTPAPRQPRRAQEQPRTSKPKAELNALAARPGPTVQFDGGTLNPSEFGPATMGPARVAEAPMANVPAPIEDRSMPAPRMRRGLFGEEIPEEVYQEMERKNREAGFYGRFKKGGSVKKKTKKYSSGGSVSSASKRADGICQKGKTKGRMV